MTDIDIEALDTNLEAERARTVAALREVADRVEQLSATRAWEALPVILGRVEELIRGVRGWLR